MTNAQMNIRQQWAYTMSLMATANSAAKAGMFGNLPQVLAEQALDNYFAALELLPLAHASRHG